MKPGPKGLPLPKRFNTALTENAYAQLHALNEKWGLGNNYLLVVLLERLGDIADADRLDQVFSEFTDEYGAPAGRMKSAGDRTGRTMDPVCFWQVFSGRSDGSVFARGGGSDRRG